MITDETPVVTIESEAGYTWAEELPENAWVYVMEADGNVRLKIPPLPDWSDTTSNLRLFMGFGLLLADPELRSYFLDGRGEAEWVARTFEGEEEAESVKSTNIGYAVHGTVWAVALLDDDLLRIVIPENGPEPSFDQKMLVALGLQLTDDRFRGKLAAYAEAMIERVWELDPKGAGCRQALLLAMKDLLGDEDLQRDLARRLDRMAMKRKTTRTSRPDRSRHLAWGPGDVVRVKPD